MRFDSSSNGYVGKGSTGSRNIGIGGNYLSNSVPVSTDTEYTFKKLNNVLTLTDGSATVTVNNSGYVLLYSLNASSDGTLKEIKIKPL